MSAPSPAPRYELFATYADGEKPIGTAGELTEANRMMLAALQAGALHARQRDTDPEARERERSENQARVAAPVQTLDPA